MKRIISTIILAAMLVLMMSTAAFAAGKGTLVITANSATVEVGAVAKITLTVEQNPGFMGMIFWPVITDAGGAKVNWNWEAEQDRSYLDFDMDAVKVIMLSRDDDCAETGVLLDVFFTVPQNAAAGVYTVAFLLYEGECLNAELEEVSTSLPTITITVTAASAAGCTHQNSTSKDAKAPTCIEDGWTAGVYCNDCNIYISGHQKVTATGHQYKVTGMDGTCGAGAVITFTCAGCGDYYTESVEVPEHSFTVYVSNGDATCTQDGTETAVCDYCDAVHTRTDEGSALGHTAAVVSGYPATCTTDGLTDGKCCSVCGEILESQAQIPAGEHLYGDWVTTQRPTCTQTGLQTRSCVTCGDTQQETLEMMPHGVATLKAVAATCNTPGLTEGVYCPGCQLVLTEQLQIEATGHSFGDWTVKIQATAESEGEEIRACANCTEQESRPVVKLEVNTENNTNVIIVIVNQLMQDTALLLVVAAVVLGGAVVLVIVALKKKNY